MIREMKALSFAEANEHIEEGVVKDFVKKFTKMKASEAAKMRDEIESLNNPKIRPEHVAKIMDIMPEDSQDIGKIFIEMGLDENESNQILEIVKKYK